MSVDELDSFQFEGPGFNDEVREITFPPTILEMIENSGKFSKEQIQYLDYLVETNAQAREALRDMTMVYFEAVDADSSNIAHEQKKLTNNIKKTFFLEKKGGRKKKRKTKKKTGGASCNKLRRNCYDCTSFRDKNKPKKRCLYNLYSGACREKNRAAGRIHGRNEWTKNADHCQIPTAEEVTPIQAPAILQREFSDGGTAQAIPILPGDLDITPVLWDNSHPEEDLTELDNRSICTRVMESAGECVISGGKRKKRKKTKRRKRKIRKKTRRKRGRKTKKKRGGATCNRFKNDCYDCTRFFDPNRPNKRCLYNLDTGDCRQKNASIGRIRGRNWTGNTDRCQIPTADAAPAIQAPATIQREFSDGGTAQAVPILPGDTEIDDNPDSSNSALSQQSNRIQISPESEWTQEDEREWRNALSSYRDYLIRQQQEAERRQEAERLREQEEWERGMFPPYHPPEYWARRREEAYARAREPLCTSIMNDVQQNCVISGGKRKKTKRRKRKMRKKTRRKKGRGKAYSRAATAATVAVLATSNPAAALKTKLPSRTEFNDAKFQLGRVCSTLPEGKQLMRKVGLQFHPDRYAVALKPQATKYMQELTEVFGNGSCGKKSSSSKRNPSSSNRNTRNKKNKSKPKRRQGESGKGARKRVKAENNTMRNIGAAIGITVTTAMANLVRKARRAYRIGYRYMNDGREDYIYFDLDGNEFPVTTQHFILYVSGMLNDPRYEDIVDAINTGEWVLDQAERGL